MLPPCLNPQPCWPMLGLLVRLSPCEYKYNGLQGISLKIAITSNSVLSASWAQVVSASLCNLLSSILVCTRLIKPPRYCKKS